MKTSKDQTDRQREKEKENALPAVNSSSRSISSRSAASSFLSSVGMGFPSAMEAEISDYKENEFNALGRNMKEE